MLANLLPRHLRPLQPAAAADGDVLVSPWHDLPFVGEGHTAEDGVVTMVCEIPMGTSAKIEVRPDKRGNPLVQVLARPRRPPRPRYPPRPAAGARRPPCPPRAQDALADGSLRYLPEPMGWNYGMVPQTWEAPAHVDFPGTPAALAGAVVGDGDPLDVIEVSGEPMAPGSVHAVKVLGAIPLIDSGEMDWKLVTLRADHALAPRVHGLADLEREMPGEMGRAMEYFETYKMGQGGERNTIANWGEPLGRDEALAVLADVRGQWERALAAKRCVPSRRRSIAVSVEGVHICDTECCWGVHLATGPGGHDEL